MKRVYSPFQGWVVAGAALAFAIVSAPASAGDEDGATISFEIGNEDRGLFAPVFEPFFDNTVGENTADGHMSWAWRLSYTPHRTNPKWFRPFHGWLPWLDDDATVRTSSSLQQIAFLPDEVRDTAGFKERPHAGFLAYEERIGLASPMTPHTQRVDTLAVTLGIVGELSGAEAMHDVAHGYTGTNTGAWNGQLENEPIVNAYYEHGRRFFFLKTHAPENVEFMPYGGLALGNALTYGAAGASIRVGGHLDKDNGPLRLNPLLNGSNFAKKGDYWAWNIFLGGEGRVVGHNIFLDGNTFQDSASVDKEVFVYDLQMGFEIGWGATRFRVANLWRSKEFETQGDPDQLLKATLSVSY